MFKKSAEKDDMLDPGLLLTTLINEMMRVVSALAHGDLTQRVPTVINGEKREGQFLIWAEMMNLLSLMASEVSRVERKVGIERKLSDQVVVPGISGIWLDFTEGINKP